MTRNRTKARAAFTLLEVLIVIVIIGILTSILILNFQGVKEKQELSLLADKSLALMQQTKAEVSNGKVELDEDGEGTYLCEGALFSVEEQPALVKMPYLETGECDFSAMSTEDYGINSGKAYVETIEVDGIDSYENLLAIFLPPSGDLRFYDEDGNTEYDGEAELSFATDTYSPQTGDRIFILSLSQVTGFAQIILDTFGSDEE